MKYFNRMEKVSPEDFAYESDIRNMLKQFSDTLKRKDCEDTSDFISIEMTKQRQVIYISIGGWEYEIIFDLGGTCQEVRFQYEDGNYYSSAIKDKFTFSYLTRRLNDIVETVVVLDDMNRALQNDVLNGIG